MPLGSIQKYFRQRFDRFIDQRIVLQENILSLNRRSIYIVPSKFGFLFGTILIAMLIGSINYEINLGFLLTFLFSAIVFTGMLLTYKNFNAIKLMPLPVDAVFANETIKLRIKPLMTKDANNIGLQVDESVSHSNLKSQQTITLLLPGQTRGIYRISRIKLFSIYPLGLFYVWSWLKTDIETIIYPQAKPLPNTYQNREQLSKSGEHSSPQQGQDELYSYKPYQEGEPVDRIAWKKTAQTGKLHSQLRSKMISHDYYIDWHQFPQANTEDRLSYMCQLILQAHNQQENYGLILPNSEVAPDHSEQHKKYCLKQLALFKSHDTK